MTCRPWCIQHLLDEARSIDVCIGPDLRLDLGNHGNRPVACSEIATDLSASATGTPVIMLHFDGEPVAELDPHQAAATAWGLLSQVAQEAGDLTAAHYYAELAQQHAAAAAAPNGGAR